MALIRVNRLTYTYPAGTTALDDLSLSVDKGEYLAVVGANGSGKSTLARCLNGLLRPPPGTISVAGLDPADTENLHALRKRLSLVFQSPPDQLVASVAEEDVAFGLENLGVPRPRMLARVEEALKAVDLLSERTRPPRFMSAGQQQRLAVAGVLVMAPECIVFDEATAMIDPVGREAILDLMDDLVSKGITIIHVTHDMAEAARAGRIVVLSEGRLAFSGSPSSLFARDDLAAMRLVAPPALAMARACGLDPVPGETAAGLALRLKVRYGTDCLPVLPVPPGQAAPQAAPIVPDGKDDHVDEASNPDQSSIAFEMQGATLEYLAGTPNARLAVDGVSFSIPRGALVALVGATGSGKSSVLQLLDALALPSAGKVLSFGLDAADPAVDPGLVRIRAPLAIQRPESAIFEQFCGDEVAFGPRNLGFRGSALVATVSKAMNLLGLDYGIFRDRHTRSLSGGQKRRLALASVLAMDSEALLFDEPGSALDPLSRAGLMSIIMDLAASGRTVVFATHSMEEAARADLMAVMGSGRLLAWGKPAVLFGESWDKDWGLRRPFAAELSAELSSALAEEQATGRAAGEELHEEF
ncbi:MAG: ABC transporter ATP-binding protein [Clostridia bacterium]